MKKHIPELFLYLIFFLIIQGCKREKHITTDVLVIGGTTSGTSAGIQSGRMGASTIIIEETPWLGGMLTAAGVSATDGNHNLNSGIWNEFRERLRKHYGGASALATGWVSNTQFEPHTGDSIFKAMAAETRDLNVIYGFHLEEIIKDGDKVTGAIFRDESGNVLNIKAEVTIDATDLGDGLALAGAQYDLGMEAQSVTGEQAAPEKSYNIVQDLTWVAILKDYGKESNKTIDKPLSYNPDLYRGSCSMTTDSILIDCSKMLTYGKLPGNKYMLNWPRHGNDIYLNVVEMDRSERQKELEKAKERTLGFVYYIQTELGYRNLGLADDEFPTTNRLALVPYHGEGRRLKGMTRFTLNNILDIYSGEPLYRTGISVGDYPVDHHHNCNPDAPEIHFPKVPSFNIPIGSLIPVNTEGLIVSDKAISVSNLINGATRLQPIVLLTGQAAGVMAALSVKHKKSVHDINIREVQDELLNSGAYIMPLFDVTPDDPDFRFIQKIASTGILKVKGEPYQWANRTWFNPDSVISVKEYCNALQEYYGDIRLAEKESKLTFADMSDILSEIKGADISENLKEIIFRRGGNYNPENPLRKRDIAVLTDELLDPFGTIRIGFDGRTKSQNINNPQVK